jgi:AraC family transcriptional regulator of adaptative response / DNA-3-methyladenine glycosylase II
MSPHRNGAATPRALQPSSPSPEFRYRAALSHDRRFDGVFYIAVSSTRVYCRPVCRSKPPRFENCRFFSSAAAAEEQGYRPCLRCRPELAPRVIPAEPDRRRARFTAMLLEEEALGDLGAGRIFDESEAGVLARRVFEAELGTSPEAFVRTSRLLMAKRMLTETDLSLADVARISGFGNSRRMARELEDRYRMPLSKLRRGPSGGTRSDSVSLRLDYRPPYDWNSIVAFLSARVISGVEEGSTRFYRRSMRLRRGNREFLGWIEIAPLAERHALRVDVSRGLVEMLPAVLGRVGRLMDLAANPAEVGRALGPLAIANPGLRVPGAVDGFEIGVRAILGQQVTVAAARTIAGRFAAAFGTPIESPFPGVATAFPRPERIADLTVDHVARLGILASRSRSIIALARAVASGEVRLAPVPDPQAEIEKLRSLPGIGEWTANYIAMRAMSWPDAFVHSDYGVMKALGTNDPRQAAGSGEAWRPWRSYAVLHLWQSLHQ